MTQFTLETAHQVIIVSSSYMPDADDFELWGNVLLNHTSIKLIEFVQGADRHAWRFLFNAENFDLNFEHYSESVWISAEGETACALLPELHKALNN